MDFAERQNLEIWWGLKQKTQDRVIKKTGKNDLRSVMCTDDASEVKDECAKAGFLLYAT